MSMQNFWGVKEVHYGIVQVVNGPENFPGLSRNGPLAGDILLCFCARHFTLTVPLSTQV